MKKCVLVVGQRIQHRAKIARVLHSAGYAIELAENQKRALELAAREDIHAAIVMHSTDLTDLEQELRERIPKTVVVGHRTDKPPDDPGGAAALDEQELLDWLDQPVSTESKAERTAPAPVKIEDCTLDLSGHAFVDGSGRETSLTRAETALLAALINNPRRALSRDQLRYAVVGHSVEPHDRSIDMLVSRLRRKIEPNAKAPRFILSVPGVGYKFAVQPQIPDNFVALPAIALEKSDRPGLREARPVLPPGQGAASHQSEPERRQLTALSCALVGSMTLAASLDPEDLQGIVQRFQELCATVITYWGGVVVNSVGDELLAFFGYPAGQEDDAERAVRAGLDLVAKVSELSEPSGAPLQTRIAIASGLVLMNGNQSAVGEAIVMAGRLRNTTPPNSVNVTTSTRKLLGNVFVCDEPHSCELEGVSLPVTAYRIVGERTSETRFDARRSGKRTLFVGRQQEMQQMSSLWERVKGGRGQVVLLCGEAGIGKSRVCDAWLDRIADEPHVIISYQCSPHHTNRPFYPIINQLEKAARFERGDAPEVKLKKLEAVLSQPVTATPAADMQFFATLLSIPTDGFYRPQSLTPRRQRDLTIAALLRQILGLALTRPVVVRLADAHWIDSSTLELLTRCITSIKNARVFVLCSFRPEFFPRWLDESHVTILRLDRLSREETAAIISNLADDKELPGGLQEQILSKADGVPLFAEELTKTVLESELIQDAGDRYVTVAPLPSLITPTTLLGSLTARLDRLGPNKAIAQIGAAIGREFSYRLLAMVAPLSGPALQAALAHLAAGELIFARDQPPNSTYIFKHALVHDAAYASMVKRKRQQLHSRIADALMESFPETVEMHPEVMAHHLTQAGLSEKAIKFLRIAGQRAIEYSANNEAIRYLARALELLKSLPENAERKHAALDLEVVLSQAMISGRGYAAPETKGTLLRAKALIDNLTDSSQRFAILYGMWACHYVGGEVVKQRNAALEFLAEAERQNDTAALCIAHRALGTTCVTSGEFAKGLHHLERARGLYDAEQHRCYRFQYGQDIGVAALCYLSWAQWHLGYVDQASEIAAEAIKQAEELSHPHTLVYAICHARGFLDLFRRRCGDIQSYANVVISLCTENGFSHWISCGRILEGWGEICRGKVDQGIELLRAGVAAWQNGGARLWLPFILTLGAEACAEASRGDVALRLIEEAFAISNDTGERWAMAEMLRVKARLLQAGGRADAGEVEKILINSLEVARSQQARCWELRASCDLARLWQSQGRRRQALKLLESVYGQFTEGFDTPDLRDAKALMENLTGQRRSAPRGDEKNKVTMTLSSVASSSLQNSKKSRVA